MATLNNNGIKQYSLTEGKNGATIERMSVLVQLINELKGCQFANIEYQADVKMLGGKKNDLQGRVTKVTALRVQLNYSYENAVNNRASKEQGEQTDFKASPLAWGEWVEGNENKLIAHKGKLYLRFYLVNGAKPTTTYFVDGVKATDEQVEQIKATLQHSNTTSNKQAESGLTENQVEPRLTELTNITRLAVSKVIWTAKNGVAYLDKPNEK